jgi:S-adenosyl-L-methionine methyltransferase
VSRLDGVIRRLTAQRQVLDFAAQAIETTPGPVLELGLGNGRTYDHLRERLPGREIFVFERKLAAHPVSLPDAAHLVLGDLRDTLPGALARIGRPAALVHCDLGDGDLAATAAFAAWLGPALAPLLAPGALVASDQPLSGPALAEMALPEGVPPQRYFLYRRH